MNLKSSPLSMVAISLLFFCMDLFAGSLSEYPSRFWMIEKNGKTNYLLGTMHVPDKSISVLPPYIHRIVTSLAHLTLEVKLSSAARTEAVSVFNLSNGESLQSMIGDRDFRRLVSIFKPYGIRASKIRELKPWAAAIMISQPPHSKEPILDFELQKQFSYRSKPVYQLETAQEQLQIFDHLDLDTQVSFLRYSIAQQPRFASDLEKMKRAYLLGDLSKLQEIAIEQQAIEERSILESLMRKIIEDRNYTMVARMQSQLGLGNGLIAVGALHLPGDEGIINLLREKGYYVNPIFDR